MQFVDPARSDGAESATGVIDYRLARRRVLRKYRAGELTKADVCDAQRELLRVGSACGEAAKAPCPVCEERDLKVVRFVFGPRLPPGGRCVTSRTELARLSRRAGEHRCYVVEVCVGCRWNHLQQVSVLGATAQV